MSDLKDLQTKDSLTESDIKTIEEKLVNQFNSRLIELTKRVIESPPTPVGEVNAIARELGAIPSLGLSVNQTINSLKSIKID